MLSILNNVFSLDLGSLGLGFVVAEPRGRAFFQDKASRGLLFLQVAVAGGEEEGMTRNDILHNLE
jgi:hypothetical protein